MRHIGYVKGAKMFLLCIPFHVGRIMFLMQQFSDRLVGNLLGSVCF